ncbi:MAG: hypothetical protein AB7I18_05575 [Candidatus Berkiella sp.]
MLDFTNTKVDIGTLLSNSNALAKFDPHKNRLRLTDDLHIVVISNEENVDHLAQLMSELSFTQEAEDTFATEKRILIWHFSQLLPFLQERFTHLRNLPIDTLRQYHDNSMQLQGFYQLCNNLSSQLTAFKQIIQQLEKPHEREWSSLFFLVQQGLSKQLTEVFNNFDSFIQQVKRQRKEKLTVDTLDIQVRAIGPLLVAGPIVRAMPREYSLGIVKIGDIRYEAKAYFQTFKDTWQNPDKFQFTGKLRFRIFQGDDRIHAAVVAYPCRELESFTEATLEVLNMHSTHETLKALYQAHPVGAIKFEPAHLRANFVDLCTHVTANEILPYCATLVDIASSHQMQRVTVFAPYQHSAVMYTCGFRTQTDDPHAPNKEQQKNQVEHAFAAGVETPILTRYRRQVTVGHEQKELLRPFSFNLHEIETAPVYLTESRVKTTYAKLLQRSTITQHEDCEQGLLPEVLQIPLHFTGVIKSLREREITGRLKRPALTYARQPVDYQTLNKDQELQDYAFADPEAATQSQRRKMLVLKKKMI